MNSSKDLNAAIVCIYLGRRGGGSGFHRDLIRELRGGGFRVLSLTREDAEFKPSHPDDFSVDAPKNRLLLKSPYISRASLLRATRSLGITNIDIVIFSMVHPRNLILIRFFHTLGIKIGSIIHDARPHKGEWYPTRRTIKRLAMKSDFVICLSNFVKKQMPQPNKVILIDFPKLSSTPPRPRALKYEYVLFIGRGKRYKGLTLLEKMWSTNDLNLHLVVAGDGHHVKSTKKQIIQISKWLSEGEIHSLIQNSKLVLCPYIEASQSGVVHMSHSLGVPTIVTPVGGLPEQISATNGIVSKTLTPSEFKRVLEQGLTRKWNSVDSPIKFGSLANQIQKFLPD